MAGGKKLTPAERQERREKQDIEHLLRQPQFLRFLSRVIQEAGIYRRTTDGSGERDLSYDTGARDLGLAILDMVEAGQPVVHPHEPAPLLTLLQIIREQANPPPSERDDDEGRNEQRYDRHAELDGDDDDDANSSDRR